MVVYTVCDKLGWQERRWPHSYYPAVIASTNSRYGMFSQSRLLVQTPDDVTDKARWYEVW